MFLFENSSNFVCNLPSSAATCIAIILLDNLLHSLVLVCDTTTSQKFILSIYVELLNSHFNVDHITHHFYSQVFPLRNRNFPSSEF